MAPSSCWWHSFAPALEMTQIPMTTLTLEAMTTQTTPMQRAWLLMPAVLMLESAQHQTAMSQLPQSAGLVRLHGRQHLKHAMLLPDTLLPCSLLLSMRRAWPTL